MRAASLQIQTPEGITFSYAVAGPVVRCMAWLVDLVVLGLLLIVLSQLASILVILSPDIAIALLMLAWSVIQIGYGIGFEWFWRGQTVGKRLLHLRVMDGQGMRLQFSQIVIRNLLRFVDSLPFLYTIGGVSCVLSPMCQRLGDIAAGTVVVRAVSVADPDYAQIDTEKYNSLRDYPHLEARLRQKVSPQQAGVALRAVLRREKLEPAARLELFRELASHFRGLVTFPQEAGEGIADEQFVRNVVEILFRNSK